MLKFDCLKKRQETRRQNMKDLLIILVLVFAFVSMGLFVNKIDKMNKK